MKFLFLILFFFVFSFPGNSQDHMNFYEDTAKMKQEILTFIPVGTDTAQAKQIMLNNKFGYDGNYVNQPFLYGGNLDFLFFIYEEGLIFCENRWKAALIYKNGSVTGVQVQFVVICL